MRIKYTGSQDEACTVIGYFKKGEIKEVSEENGKFMLTNPDFKEVREEKKSKEDK